MTFLSDWIGFWTALDRMPLWAIYLILLLLSMGVWYLVVLVFVSIARSMG